MNKRFAIIYIILFTQLVSAGANEEFEKARREFVGHWKVQTGDRLTTVNWKEDGTWTSNTTEAGKLVWSLQGVWWVADGALHGVCLKSSDPKISLGMDQPSGIIDISEAKYTIKNSKDQVVSYQRIKEPGDKP